MDLAEGFEDLGAVAELQLLHLGENVLQHQVVRRTAAHGDPRAVKAQDLVVRALVRVGQARVSEGGERVRADRHLAHFLCDYDGSHECRASDSRFADAVGIRLARRACGALGNCL